jgi:hypothetical protein
VSRILEIFTGTSHNNANKEEKKGNGMCHLKMKFGIKRVRFPSRAVLFIPISLSMRQMAKLMQEPLKLNC